MKNNIVLVFVLFFTTSLFSQVADFKSLPKYDCNHKKWIEFSKDTVIVVQPTNFSYQVNNLLSDLYAFLNYRYIIKTEKELKKTDLNKSLLIVGKASDFKKWKSFNLPIRKSKKGFVFNDKKFYGKQDALWLNDYNRIVITANDYSALKTILDMGQLGMDFFSIQNNQLTYFGNLINDKTNNIKWFNTQNLKQTNYSFYKEDYVNFYISKKFKDSIDVEKINKNLKDYVNKYAEFFDISIPENKVNALIHYNQEEMINMIGMWNLSCGGRTSGMNVRGEIHSIGANQNLLNHEVSHHIFNSNIPAEKLPPLLLEGVVEVFTNFENNNLYKERLDNVYKNWMKFNFKELFENSNSFYNSNSDLNYKLSGLWVKYLIDNYGLNEFKSFCLAIDKISFLELKTNQNFQRIILHFKNWLKIENQNNNKLSVEFNKNIATYSIVEKLVAYKEGRLFYIDGKADDDYLPMVDLAFDQMNKFDNSKIIQQTIEYLNIVGFQQDLTYLALLRANDFPKKGYKYSLDNLNLEQTKFLALKKYIENLNRFYIDRELDSFFDTNAHFINGGIKEVINNAPKNYLSKMEKYYGEKFAVYKFYINPFDAVPYEIDFWHGNGPKILTEKGTIANMISSAYLPLKKQTNIDEYQEFGFNYPKTIKFLITHEFGHSFVNHTLKSYTNEINKYENLFYSGLNEKMNPQGYSNWTTCIIEHFVRLGEIRIAVINGEKERARQLREMHINEFSFVLIPYFEKTIIEYEKNRDKYPTFKDFVPNLISTLNSINPKEIRKSLGLSNKTYKMTINLKVKNKSDEVFIVGNQQVLGNWNPKKIKMTKTSNFMRSITLDLYSDAKFKFTKGTWENEGYVKGIINGNDIRLVLGEDKTLDYQIDKWK